MRPRVQNYSAPATRYDARAHTPTLTARSGTAERSVCAITSMLRRRLGRSSVALRLGQQSAKAKGKVTPTLVLCTERYFLPILLGLGARVLYCINT